MRILLGLLLASIPVTAAANSDEDPFSDFRISGSVVAGGGSSTAIGGGVSAKLQASGYVPLFTNFGLRPGVTFLSQRNFDVPNARGVVLIGVGGGADYTIRMGERWGLGIAGGAEFVPYGLLDLGPSTVSPDLRGVNFFQEVVLRRVIGVGLWAFGLRADEFFGSGHRVINVGAFFRFSFRI